MPLTPRRNVLTQLGVLTANALLNQRPAVATDTKAPFMAVADALKIPAETTSIALWGSSSMEGGLGQEHTPKPVYIHEELANSFNPLPVHNVAYGALWSTHSMILRGLIKPQVDFIYGSPLSGTGKNKVQVEVRTEAPGLWSFTCHGQLSSGVSGTLTGFEEDSWFFEPDPEAVASFEGWDMSGTFTSDWLVNAQNSRHVIWTGKNNIGDMQTVDSHIDALVNAARDPIADVIVLGHWVTQKDLESAQRIRKVHDINSLHKNRYGDRFIDVQALLTSPEAMQIDTLNELKLWQNEQTQAEIELGIVPTPLRGSDGIHLSGWGNLLVAKALIERMKELKWL